MTLLHASAEHRRHAVPTPARRGPDGVVVLDTTEIRWFVTGELPVDVRRWFIGPAAAAAEARRDRYLLDGRTDVGLKFRNGETLEFKARLQTDPVVDLVGGLVGVVERWRKWTPADGLVRPSAARRWVDVDKWIVKRRFELDGTEVQFSPVRNDHPACDVEVASVRAAGSTAWSLAFAASGPRSSRLAALGAAWRALLPAEMSTISEVGLDRGRSMGYPEWLSRQSR